MNMQVPEAVTDGVVVSLDYTLRVDGRIIDSSEGREPIQFLQGHGQVISGLEEAIGGMKAGERKSFSVSPEKGYGEEDPDAFAEIPRSEFPENFPLDPGTELMLTDEEGEELEAFVISAGDEVVRLNFNHPLAGKNLHFEVEIAGLRNPTPEELEHGHAHTHEHDD